MYVTISYTIMLMKINAIIENLLLIQIYLKMYITFSLYY